MDEIKENFSKYCSRYNWKETPEQLETKTKDMMKGYQSVFESVLNSGKPSFETVIKPLANEDIKFTDESAYIGFFQYVSTNEAVRNVSTQMEKEMSEFSIKLGMNKPMFDKYLQVQSLKEPLGCEEDRLLSRWVLNGKRNGLNLDEQTRTEVEALSKKMSNLSIEFNKNLNSENTILLFDESELTGLPRDIIEGLKMNGAKFEVTLKYPHVIPILKYVEVESTRKEVSSHFNSRCISENIPILQELVKLRHKRATLLGYKTHAQFTIEKLMAKSTQVVVNFLTETHGKLQSLRESEMDVLLKVKQEYCSKKSIVSDSKINLWDVAFFSNLVEKNFYSVDHNEIKKYFDFNSVIVKLLDIYQEILQLEFKKVEDPLVWHTDVSLYAVIDRQEGSANGQIIGYFYLDLFPRMNKYSHAACFTLQSKCQLPNGDYQPGVAAMVANFSKPKEGEPCYFTHDEVEVFFHEFGHVMHALCSTNKYVEFSGTNVERDFVEAPSQMFENWIWSKQVLKRISQHGETGQIMSDDLIEKLIKSRKANAGIFYSRQICFAMFDQMIHSKENVNIEDELKHSFEKYYGISIIPGTNMAASFGHMAGGYDARYYGYLFSEVIAVDMFASNFKDSVFSPTKGLAYRLKVLGPGGSKDGMDIVRDFLGREPCQDSFIEQIGC